MKAFKFWQPLWFFHLTKRCPCLENVGNVTRIIFMLKDFLRSDRQVEKIQFLVWRPKLQTLSIIHLQKILFFFDTNLWDERLLRNSKTFVKWSYQYYEALFVEINSEINKLSLFFWVCVKLFYETRRKFPGLAVTSLEDDDGRTDTTLRGDKPTKHIFSILVNSDIFLLKKTDFFYCGYNPEETKQNGCKV